ncbi:hypothetical protein ACK129_16815 [Pseudomonas citrulli]|jgi:hypothetical protein|uniref:Uncharacterized protein n=1 Tax=Pseudomonas lurida TaxID=244566 RepID=A0ABY9FP40_9PSED|nr:MULTISPECIES: hypothetical protein [Pseudomonas]WLG54844.1 hypothetical protein PSH77_19465 [Pseudomonas extremorientalis]WLH05080.1 hypothetical protein PSH67_19815 [Pseudomonas lurida]
MTSVRCASRLQVGLRVDHSPESALTSVQRRETRNGDHALIGGCFTAVHRRSTFGKAQFVGDRCEDDQGDETKTQTYCYFHVFIYLHLGSVIRTPTLVVTGHRPAKVLVFRLTDAAIKKNFCEHCLRI